MVEAVSREQQSVPPAALLSLPSCWVPRIIAPARTPGPAPRVSENDPQELGQALNQGI